MLCAARGTGFRRVSPEENIMELREAVVAVLLAGLAFAGLSGCEKSEGPAEKAGKAIDKAASDMSDRAKETMDDIKKNVNE
jgi:hypothetical protein